MRMLKYFKKKTIAHKKLKKTTLKSCSEKLKSTFFPLLPAQPKWPKQKNSPSKMWPIDQLYIELGLQAWYSVLCKQGLIERCTWVLELHEVTRE